MCIFHSVNIYVHVNLCVYWTDSNSVTFHAVLFMDIIWLNNKELLLLVMPMGWVIFKEGVDILSLTRINIDLKQVKPWINFARLRLTTTCADKPTWQDKTLAQVPCKILYRQEPFNSGLLLRIWWHLELSNISVVLIDNGVSVFVIWD
jgi:hypothetical protein